jgi:uncharacterized OsmC-like protein
MSIMVDYPIEVSATAEAEKSGDGWHLNTDENLKTDMSLPEEFGGSSETPSPEDLFNASVMSCVIATFKSIAERQDLDYESIKTEAESVLDRGKDTRPVITESSIEVTVRGVNEDEKAERAVSATRKNCFIHNSVKTDVQIDFSFSK